MEIFLKKITFYIQSMRIYQWIKNFLVFVPMFLANQVNLYNFTSSSITFISFSLAASAVYISNDIFDLEKDRKHPRKKKRVLASRKITITEGYFLLSSLAILSLLIGICFLNIKFTILLVCYFLLNFLYSSFFKGLKYTSLILLSSFYVMRVISGGFSSNLEISIWLLIFSLSFFFGLASLKRLSEMRILSEEELQNSKRGFKLQDYDGLKFLSISSSLLGSSVLLIYLFSNQAAKIYENLNLLYFMPVLLFIWFINLWFAGIKGKIIDDPIIFASRDRKSLFVAFLIFIFFISSII